MQSVNGINQTGKAAKKLATIAILSRLPYQLVAYMFSFHWNMDGREGAWIYDRDLLRDEAFNERSLFLFNAFNAHNGTLSRTAIIELLNQKLQLTDEAELLNSFIAGAAAKDYWRVSEFASYWYMRNASLERLATLDGPDEPYTPHMLIKNLFFKVFRGGAVERYQLGYLYADLVCRMPCQQATEKASAWLQDFLEELTNTTAKPSLTGLRDMLKRHLKGDKRFLQTVLEALSYAGYLKVDGHPVANIFIPDYRNELASHFNSNEWTYPLRFW